MTSLLIFSDPICPWCLIGKRRLDVALAARPGHPFKISFQPFMLNPDMPPEGMDRGAYLRGKFGSPEGLSVAYAPVFEAFKAEGIEADPTAPKRTPATVDAHRLLHWAELEGCHLACVDALFEAYFMDGRDISDRDVLSDIADGVGLDAALIRRLLGSEADVDTIRAADASAREMGIQAAPTFVVAGAHAVPGAQEAALWIRVIDELMESDS